MAIAAGAIFEVRTTGAQSNGAGFVPGASGVDYSQQDAAQYALTGVTTAAANAIMLSASAATDMVGNICRVVSGTNFTVGLYEIISVVAGVSITVDRNVTSAAGALGVVNIGGAFLLGGTFDDDFFEQLSDGNIVYIKAGTYTLGEGISTTSTGGSQQPIKIAGYNSTRGDNPAGTSRPLIATGSNTFTFGANHNFYNLQVTGTGVGMFTVGGGAIIENCKVICSSTTAARNAMTLNNDALVINCEAVSYRGIAIFGSAATYLFGCYVHDSNIGYNTGNNTTFQISNCIIAGCIAQAVNATSGPLNRVVLANNTLYGAENKLGVGVQWTTTATDVSLVNNIIYGFVTGVALGAAQTQGYDDYNNYYNNTDDVDSADNWQKGANDIAVDPQFSSMAQRTGATATTTAGDHLVQSGATFQTWGVTPGRDFLYVVSGTGVTAGIYGILSVDSETQITTDISLAANATADKVWQITTGRNFYPNGAV